MKRKCWIIVLLCLVLFTSACSENKEKNSQENNESAKSMTLMIYMVGSDLEAATAAATNDMKEMEASGVDLSQVKLLIYTGGSPKWHNDTLDVPTDTHAVFTLTEQGFSQVSDFEAMSMGEPDSLTRFLQYGYENYKSESYGLILWDHGNGPVMGYGSDLQYEQDALTLPEIETALAYSPFGNEQKLDFIGFDACLMASAELACIVDDYADYLIASQEVEPGFGWNYQFLSQCGKINLVSLLQEIIEQYISYSEKYFEQNEFFKSEVTLAAIDLSYAKELEESIDHLFGIAAEDVSGSFNQLALDRVETRAFGRAATGSEYDLVDVQALMDSMSDSYSEETKEVQNILQEMVIYSDSNTVDSCGLSLYYPYYNKKYYEISWKDSYDQLGLFPNYINYLERYGQIWLGTDMKEYFSGKLVAKEERSGTYTLQLNDTQAEYYADGGYYILRRLGDEVYTVLYYSKNVTNTNGLLTANFDGRVLYYGNEFGIVGIPVTRALDEVNGQMRYTLFPVVTGAVSDFLESDSLNCRMVLSVNEETGEVTVLDFSESSDEEIQTGKKNQIDLDDWVRIQFFEISGRYLTRDEEGRILQYWQWPQDDWILWNEVSLADGLTFTYEPLYDDGGEYFLMFDVMDVQGNSYSSELYPITLEKRPPEAAVQLSDSVVVEDSSTLIFDREGVKLYIELIEDESVGEATYCFKAENSNDFPVRISMDEMMINDSINCTDVSGYISIDAKSVHYSFMNEITKVCMLEQIDIPKQLSFCVNMSNAGNDQTLIYEESFSISFAETSHAKRTFIEYMGARAEEQVLLDESEGLKVSLLGAGYRITRSNYMPDSEYSTISGILRIENCSSIDQNIRIDTIVCNDLSISTDDMFSGYKNEISLASGQVYYYIWEVEGSVLLEQGISEINSLKIGIKAESANRTLAENLEITLLED